MFSYSFIKLLPFHNLSLRDIFTDKPKNRKKTTGKFLNDIIF